MAVPRSPRVADVAMASGVGVIGYPGRGPWQDGVGRL